LSCDYYFHCYATLPFVIVLISPGSTGTAKDDNHGTVGAVALDSHGNVAYATSTGGINAKMPGRMGDSPIIGESYAVFLKNLI